MIKVMHLKVFYAIVHTFFSRVSCIEIFRLSFELSQELELLPVKELQNNIYIKHPVSMEQYLMEGSFNKVHFSLIIQYLEINVCKCCFFRVIFILHVYKVRHKTVGKIDSFFLSSHQRNSIYI